MKDRLLALEAEFREAKVPGLVAEFIYSMDEDPLVCYEAVVFESKEAYRALADCQNRMYAIVSFWSVWMDRQSGTMVK